MPGLRKPYSSEKVNNPTYFRFVDLVVEGGKNSAFPVGRDAAICYVEYLIHMVREEYRAGGLEQLHKLLNINLGGGSGPSIPRRNRRP